MNQFYINRHFLPTSTFTYSFKVKMVTTRKRSRQVADAEAADVSNTCTNNELDSTSSDWLQPLSKLVKTVSEVVSSLRRRVSEGFHKEEDGKMSKT